MRNLLISIQFLTRLPIPTGLQSQWTMADLRDSVHMFPLVGLLVGAAASLVYACAILCNLPPALAAIIAVASQVLITGALHEDGLADVCDGFGGGRTRDRKLEIMRDSRLGSYGAIGLMLSLGLRATAIAELATLDAIAAGLITASALSRAAMPAAMLILPQARADGLAASAGRPKRGRVLIGIAIGLWVSLLCLSVFATCILFVACALAAWLFLSMSQRQIGGITGDVLGGLQQVLEIVILVTVIALAVGSA